jgi:5-methylcytosine-specific restriction protein A
MQIVIFYGLELVMPWSKESRQSRGYGAEWEKARLRVIERDKGLCQPCLRDGRVTQFKDVDHVVSRDLAAKRGWTHAKTEHPDNLQCICTDCHKRKTAEEKGGTYRPRVQIGLDGWPVES